MRRPSSLPLDKRNSSRWWRDSAVTFQKDVSHQLDVSARELERQCVTMVNHTTMMHEIPLAFWSTIIEASPSYKQSSLPRIKQRQAPHQNHTHTKRDGRWLESLLPPHHHHHHHQYSHAALCVEIARPTWASKRWDAKDPTHHTSSRAPPVGALGLSKIHRASPPQHRAVPIAWNGK